MTTDSNSSYNGQVLPIWDTWCGSEEVFTKTCRERPTPFRKFESPNQVDHSIPAAAVQVLSFNKFNPSMAEFTQTPHPGPGNLDYDYTGQTTPDVVTLNDNWPAGTPTPNRKIVETPYSPPTADQQGVAAIETKPVFLLVKQDGLTPIPFWQGPQASTDPSTPTPATWTTCVLFDPSQPAWQTGFQLRDATPEEIAGAVADPALKCQNYSYAPLGQIYRIKLDADEAAAWNLIKSQSPPDAPQQLTATAGDFAVLVAMHVNTKEIIDWTWQTFWWQAGENAPNNDPGGVENMTTNVEREWRNYAMCANYLQTKGEGSNEMDICFNPYLETAFGVDGGLKSNCMSCHGQAIVGGTPGYPTSFTSPIDFNNGPYYEKATSTDFSWAIASNQKKTD